MSELKALKARNEVFGKTVFDPNTFKHFFMHEEEFKNFRMENVVEIMDNTVFHDTPNILFSPIRVYFDLTLDCNLRCRTCLNNSGESLEDELNLEESMKVIEGLKKDYIFDVRFSGGEPTLKKGWDMILKKAKDEGLTISLNTNGILSDKNLNKLIEINPDETTVSLDGFGEHNDYLRGKGSFDRAISSIKYLKENGCRVTINSTLTSIIDDSDIKGLLDFASEYCDDISFFHLRPLGRAENEANLLLDYDELGLMMRRINDEKKKYPELFVRTGSESLKSNSIDSKDAKKYGLEEGGSDGFTRFNIMYNGDLFAGGCVPYINQSIKDDLKLGNIIEEDYSLLKVWRFNDKLREIRKMSRKLKNRCNNCSDYTTTCSGFTLEMELYGRIAFKKNIYCKRGGVS